MRRSQSPLSPAASATAQSGRQPRSHDSMRHSSSRHARSGSPQSPTLQPAATPRMTETPTLGTGTDIHMPGLASACCWPPAILCRMCSAEA